MVIQNLLAGLTQPVDAQEVLANPLYNLGALLSPQVAAQTPRLTLLARQQEQEERRQELEDFYRRLGGLPASEAGDTDAAPAAGAGIPPSGIPPGMGGLVGQPAAPAGQVDVLAGLAGGGGAPMGNFTAGAAPQQQTLPPSSPASAPPPTSPQDIEGIARQMIASGIPEVANQGIGLLSQVQAQQARLAGGGADPAAVREYQYFQNLPPDEQQEYLRLKRGTERVVTVGDVPYRFDATTGALTPLATPEEVGAAAGIVGGAEARATAVGRRAGEIAAEDLPQSQRAQRQRQVVIEGQAQRLTLVEDTIDKAISQANPRTTGFFGAQMARIPGTPAADLANTLSTIQANIGFGELQRMRDASPTGGALGQVSERELALLNSVLGAVAQSQTDDQLIDNLRRLKAEVRASWERIDRAYKQDLEAGLFTEQDLPPPQAGAVEEATPRATRRYNRETGQFEAVP